MTKEEIKQEIDDIDVKRNSIMNKMKSLNQQWSHDHPTINVNRNPKYKELVDELLALDHRAINLKDLMEVLAL